MTLKAKFGIDGMLIQVAGLSIGYLEEISVGSDLDLVPV